MATLTWNPVGGRLYQTGIDHGVLYLQDGTVAPWNGLIDVEESQNSELKEFYLDGVKYLQNLTPGEFLGKLKAFTYPDEFDWANGLSKFAPGLSLYEQPSKSFSLSYRTKVGNDLEGLDYGYKIHILYNVIAQAESYVFETTTDSGIQPIEFGWSLSGTPQKLPGFRPTVHVTINSLSTPSGIMKMIEDRLYGTDTSQPKLPSLQEVAEFFGYLGALLIIDHGDGTWSAIDESDTFITMIDESIFQIDNADATYSDPDTYEISSTNVGGGS